MVFVPSQQKDVIFDAVRAMYTDVALHPERTYHFPTGAEACAFVGYPAERIARLPPGVTESFAGVGYPFAANVIRPGDTVLDVGAGSGTDLLIASELVGTEGSVIGLDMTPAMLAKLESSAAAAGALNVRVAEGNVESAELASASVDVVTSNGVLNLVPDKRAAFAQLFRALRPGGRLQIADIALGLPISEECRSDPRLWAECVVGATLEDEYLALLAGAGFEQIEVLGRLDYFSASSSPATRSIARSFGALALVLRAAKPPSPALSAPLPWPPRAAAAAGAPPDGVNATGADAANGLDAGGGRASEEAGGRPDVEALPDADAVLDAHGQLCGTLEPVLRAHMDRLSTGQVLEVLTDDPAARLGLPAWSRLAGYTLLATVEEDARRTRFFLRGR